MPNKPIAKQKVYQEKTVQHKRTKNMAWFYNHRKWRKFSAMFRLKYPYCIQCERQGVYTPTAVTDHIDVYEVRPEGFDLDNLREDLMQPLCNKCHAKKSGKEGKKNKIIVGYGVKSMKG